MVKVLEKAVVLGEEVLGSLHRRRPGKQVVIARHLESFLSFARLRNREDRDRAEAHWLRPSLLEEVFIYELGKCAFQPV